MGHAFCTSAFIGSKFVTPIQFAEGTPERTVELERNSGTGDFNSRLLWYSSGQKLTCLLPLL